jgi:hypothetical protein
MADTLSCLFISKASLSIIRNQTKCTPHLLVVGMIVDAAPVLSPRVVSLPKKREEYGQMAEKGFPQTMIIGLIGSVCTVCVYQLMQISA